MTYRVNRALGYQKWGVTNPWVFANYGQPQRQRGNVSPMVFQTAGPYLKSAHLGQTAELVTGVESSEVEKSHRKKMETIAMVGLAISATSLFLAWRFHSNLGRRMKANMRRRRRRRTSRRR